MLSRSPLETLVQIPFGWNWWFNLLNGVLFLAPLPALQPALQNGGSGHNVPHALEEGWPSGRRRALGERVYACVPWVRIPPPPPPTDLVTCPRRLVQVECWCIAGFSTKLGGRRSGAGTYLHWASTAFLSVEPARSCPAKTFMIIAADTILIGRLAVRWQALDRLGPWSLSRCP